MPFCWIFPENTNENTHFNTCNTCEWPRREAIFFFRRSAAPGTKSNARDDHGQRTTVPYPRPLSGHAGRRAKRGVVQAHRQGAPSDSGESGPLRPPRLRTGLQEVPRGSRTGGEPKRSDRLAERVAGRSEAVIFHSVVPLGLRDGGTARRGVWGSAGKSFRIPGQQRGVRVLSRERGLGRKDRLVLRFWRAAGASQVGESSRMPVERKGLQRCSLCLSP